MRRKKLKRAAVLVLWLLCAALIISAVTIRFAADIIFPLWASALFLFSIFTIAGAALLCQIIFAKTAEEPTGIFAAKILTVVICWAAVIYNIIKAFVMKS